MQPPEQRLMPAAQLAAKVREYEQFANDVLKTDLQKTTAQRAKHQAEIEELEELRRNIQHLHEQQKVGKTPADASGARIFHVTDVVLWERVMSWDNMMVVWKCAVAW
jgi:5-methylcytosine-specific restriction endonuclease McrBC regulatory subunit McrC